MRPWLTTMSNWLVDYYALATVVLAAAAVVIRLLRQPARRISVARSSVVGLAVLAVLAALPGWPRTSWRLRPGQKPSDRPTIAAASGPDSGITTSAPHGTRLAPRDAMPTVPSLPAGRERSRAEGAATQSALDTSARIPRIEWMSDWRALAGRAFVVGVALVVAWLGIGLWQTAVLRRSSRPAPQESRDLLASIVGDGRAAPDLLVSGRLAHPVAVGVLNPAIVLPERFVEDEPRGRLEVALAHEWVHIRNRDLWWITVSGLLLSVLFAHPVYWWLRRRTREDQELLADAAAAQGRVDYAEALLAWATRMPRRSAFAVGGSLALWERPSQLKRRIMMLLDRDFRVEPTCPRCWGLGVRAGTALAVLVLSFTTFRPSVVGANLPGAKTGRAVEAGPTGLVLDPNGKPVAGATVYRSQPEPDPNGNWRNQREYRNQFVRGAKAAVVLTRTSPDGSFRVPKEDLEAARDQSADLVTLAEGYGPAFLDPAGGNDAPVLRLARDDVPIRGRVIDIKGRPVARAKIQLVAILRPNSGTLDEWLAALKRQKSASSAQSTLLRSWSGRNTPSLFPALVADRDGRFTLKGVGRERIAVLRVEGPGIETLYEYVATRDMPAVKVPPVDEAQRRSRDVVFHGAAPELAAGPGLEIVGTVRDKDSGQPLPDIIVQTTTPLGNPPRYDLKTTTDARGNYRLSGLPLKNVSGQDQELLACAQEGAPYVGSLQNVGDVTGPGSVRKDFALRRGSWARGRVIDQATGNAVPARLEYFMLEDNPHVKDYPDYGPYFSLSLTDENGAFKVAVIPGRGILGAQSYGPDRLGAGLENIKGLHSRKLAPIPALPHPIYPANFHTLVEIDPRPGEESVMVDIALDRGRTLKGKLVGPDGEPVAGALMMGAEDHFQGTWSERPLATAEFEVHALGTERKRGLLFYHAAKQLAGAYVVKPDEAGPVTVRLEPCGTWSGRLVDRDGLPQAGAQLTCNRTIFPEDLEDEDPTFERGALPSSIKTDKDGRFRFSGLVPGLKYSLEVFKDGVTAGRVDAEVSTQAGEVKELGDFTLESD